MFFEMNGKWPWLNPENIVACQAHPSFSKTGLILARIFKRVTGRVLSRPRAKTILRRPCLAGTRQYALLYKSGRKTKRYVHLSEKKIPLLELVRSCATWPFCYHQLYLLFIIYLKYFINETVLYRYDEFNTTIMQLDFLNRFY